MKDLYICTFPMTEKLFLSWIAEHKRIRLFRLLWLLAGVVFTGILVWLQMWFYAAFVLLFCLFQSFIGYKISARKQYKTTARRYGKDSWNRTVIFRDNEIFTGEENVCATYRYEEIDHIREDGDYIRIYFKNETALRLYASHFQKGTWTECKAFLQSKTTV